ncbi:MAG: hypothetical protein CMD32_07800 [Flavobacteriales bacterium]|jgi:hypothetical protein|nr:hypothetical protein [Flavobacteriales bacterium]|tara:strand:- start:2286 stop:2537 length:252 start_codon:yes stop_codon:yes gene_type:complete
MIKSILLVNNIILLSKIEEVGADIGEPDCKLVDPYIINQSTMALSPWMLDFSDQTDFMISSDKILTITDPTEQLIKKYNSLVK